MPVRVEGHRPDAPPGLPRQSFWNGPGAPDEAPSPDRPAERGRHDRLTVGLEGDSRNDSRVGQRRTEGLPHRDLPESRDASLRAGEDPPAVGTKGHAKKRAIIGLDPAGLLAGGDVPEAGGSAANRGQEGPAPRAGRAGPGSLSAVA